MEPVSKRVKTSPELALKNTARAHGTEKYRTIYYSGDGLAGEGTKYLNSSVAREKSRYVYTFKAPSTPGPIDPFQTADVMG